MPPVLTKAPRDSEHYRLLADAIKKFHPDLIEAEVTYSIYLVSPDDGDEPALKDGGYSADVVSTPTSYKQRVKGHPDAEIEIDSLLWETRSLLERAAIMDHAAQRLEVARTKKGGVVKSDKLGRPVLRKRKYDLRMNGFQAVISRYKAASPESRQYRAITEVLRQRHFEWGDDCAAQDGMPADILSNIG